MAVSARRLRPLAAAALVLAATALRPPDPAVLGECADWLLRPALLPFAWRGYGEARRHGTPAETFARARQILRLVPAWTDGHLVFALGFVMAPPTDATRSDAGRVDDAWRRFQLAQAWLEAARAGAGRQELGLLEALAVLPRAAVHAEPGLAARLAELGGAAALTARYYAEIERRFPSQAAREQRTFQLPSAAAALLGLGQRREAVELLRHAIDRSRDVVDRAVAAEWSARLQEIVRHLEGQPTPLEAVFADPRFEPLFPHLR